MTQLAFDRSNAEHVRAVQSLLMVKAAEARRSFPAFLEFVMREQTTRRKIRLAPHQRVGADFVAAHNRCVLVWPAGAAKTFLEAGYLLWMLGKDPTSRWALISATQAQAMLTLDVVREAIEGSHELRLVFPHLRPMRGAWSTDAITVERPSGIRDASVAAFGDDTERILGSRLSGAVIDDLLNDKNTATKEQREKAISFVKSSVLSRLDANGRCLLSNTVWHPEDAVHYFSSPTKGRWPALWLDAWGDVQIKDDPVREARGEEPWDHELLRPKYRTGADYTCRLVRPGVDDSKNDVPLFPERFLYSKWQDEQGNELPPATTMVEAVDRARVDLDNKLALLGPIEFNRQHMGIARHDATAMCQEAWIERCKKAARDLGHFSMVSKYDGRNATFTGLDLAVGLGEENDETAFFTFEVLPNRLRRILDIEIGRWPGPVIVKKLVHKVRAYRSVARVENNGAQEYLRQQAIWEDASLMIEAHTTGRAKAHPEHGVPGGFVEMSNGAWLIPNDSRGNVHPHVQKWIDGCLYYVPSHHTDDSVMAWYFARAQAAAWGLLAPPPKKGGGGGSFDPRRR